MGLQNMGFSKEVTGGTPLTLPTDTDDVGELHRIIYQLGAGTHYIENPEQALDLILKNSTLLAQRTDKDFYVGVLYILGEYLRGNSEYNINGVDNVGASPEEVNIIRNRKGIISKQVLEILQNPDEQNYDTNVKITDIDFKELSQKIIDFILSNATAVERKKIQILKNILLSRLELGVNTDWTIILSHIEKNLTKNKQSKKTA